MSENEVHPDAASRRIACMRCGANFDCDLSGHCWCAAEAVRLPMPARNGSDGDCLCRECLRAAAEKADTRHHPA